MGGVTNAVAGLVGQDAGSRDKKDQANAQIAQAQAKAEADQAKLDAEKKRQLDIANQNKIDLLRRRKGSSSLLSGDGSSTNSATQTTLG